MDKVELLSPAGNFEKLKMALEFGADAVYVGAYKYSLRAKSMNLSFNEIEKALEYAHKMDRKVYIALNIFCRNSDLNEIEKYLNVISEMEVDGLIVSDKGLIRLIKEKFSKLDIILSTQANVMNKGSAKIWEDLGVKRVTLARELSLEEIKEITSSIDAEVEVFVHGSLCISYAGNCFLSLYITGRDGNRGECSQCCRWKYYLVKEGEKEKFEILSDCDNSYILNSKDFCLAEHVPQLIKAGVKSLKIEGRNRSIYYVGAVTSIYRKIIDDYFKLKEKYTFKKEYRDELGKIPHRPYTNGFIDKNNQEVRISNHSSSIQTKEFIGYIKESKNGISVADVKLSFSKGEIIEALEPGGRIKEIEILDIMSFPEKKNKTIAKEQNLFYIKTSEKIKKYSIIRKIKNNEMG